MPYAMPTPSATGSLSFSTNWNNKLSCPCFTTFRPSGEWHRVGRVYVINFQNKPLKRAKIIAKRTLRLAEVNEWMARIDTGYGLEEFRGILRKMYTGKFDVEQALFDFLLLETINQ